MAFLNKVMLIGRLIDNPEPPRVFQNTGNTVVKFRFAVGRSKKNATTGQWENDPNPLFIDCDAFGRAENPVLTDLISRYCVKGTQLYIEGRLMLDQWDDKTTGQKRSKHKVVVERIEFLGQPQGEVGGPRPAGRPAPAYSGGGGYGGGMPDDMNEPPPMPPAQGDEGGDNIPF